jgi:hypothetical protein
MAFDPKGIHVEHDDPVSMITALSLADQQSGGHQEGDYVLIEPSLGFWFLSMVKIDDPDLAVAFEDLVGLSVDDGDLAPFTTRPISVTIEPPNWEDADLYPSSELGQKLLVRLMNSKEVDGLEEEALTVRADGAIIHPGSGPTTLQEISAG